MQGACRGGSGGCGLVNNYTAGERAAYVPFSPRLGEFIFGFPPENAFSPPLLGVEREARAVLGVCVCGDIDLLERKTGGRPVRSASAHLQSAYG